MRNTYLQQCDFGSRFRILKGGKISLVVSAFIASITMLQAAPSGGVVTAGSASISQNGSVTNITQTSGKAAINWQNFSIGTHETVNFVQPSVNAVTLNRVIGNEKSIIDGALNANGQVFILNSNGVLFSKNASINTAGLVATTMNLSDADFMNGNYNFKGESAASVINQGTIDISDKGYAALFGKEVKNEGIIKATLGKVELVGAKEVTLNLNGNSLINLKVDKGVLDALVENKGAIYADGGEVYLTTNAVGELLDGVVNNTGMIRAQSFEDVTGKIELFAHGGTANVSGTLNAEGGFVETSGKTLHVSDTALIKAYTWLLDPDNIVIESSGGAVGGDSVSATAIQNALSANIELSATYDITVNEAITWSSDKKLTLTAGDQIYVNATISNTNASAGGVYFQAFNITDRVIFGVNGKVVVYNPEQLQWINTALTGKYELGANIDASATSGWNVGDHDNNGGTAAVAMGFVPIGTVATPFTGAFNGLGHTIDALFINRPKASNIGLFGVIGSGAKVENIGVTNVNITGSEYTGGLIGVISAVGTNVLSHAYSTGSVNGTAASAFSYSVGGLVGYLGASSIVSYAHSLAAVNVSTINNIWGIGGLVGENRGTISDSYFAGTLSVSASDDGFYIGGLVGLNYGGISNSYSAGSVATTLNASHIGGFVGLNSGTILNSYATGSVTTAAAAAVWNVGGFVGTQNLTSIQKSYSNGLVSSSGNNVGGFVGAVNAGTISSSFWDTQTSGQSSSAGGAGVVGKTTAELQKVSTFDNAGWDVGTGTSATPSLSMGGTHVWTMLPETVNYTLSDISNTYNGSAYTLSGLWNASSLFGASHSSWVLGTDYTFLDTTNAVVTSYTNAGTYSNLHVNILRSGYTQVGSVNTAGMLTINPKTLTITAATTANKVYNGDTTSVTTAGALSGFVGTETVSASVVGTFADKNVADNITVTDVYTLANGTNGGLASNYMLANTISNANITPKTLTITGTTTANKVYDGDTTSVTTAGTLSGFVGTETVSASVVGTFADKNVADNITVTHVYTLANGINGGLAINYMLANTTSSANITPAPVTQTPTPTPDISHIENGTAIIPPRLNIDTPRLVNANPPSYINAEGQRVQVMSTPLLDVPTVMVSTQQVRVIQGVESGDLRVPMMQGSLIYLLNGGLNLPNGVEQEFFMLANR